METDDVEEILEGDCLASKEVRANHTRALRLNNIRIREHGKDIAAILASIEKITTCLEALPELKSNMDLMCKMMKEMKDDRKEVQEWRRLVDEDRTKLKEDVKHNHESIERAWGWVHGHEEDIARWDLQNKLVLVKKVDEWQIAHDKRVDEEGKWWKNMIFSPVFNTLIGAMMLAMGLGVAFLIYKAVFIAPTHTDAEQDKIEHGHQLTQPYHPAYPHTHMDDGTPVPISKVPSP